MMTFVLGVMFASPAVAAFILAIQAMFRREQNENCIAVVTQLAFWTMLAASLSALLGWVFSNREPFRWLGLYLDINSFVFLCVISTLLNVIIYYSRRYMHRDPGYRRFFMILSIIEYLKRLFFCPLSRKTVPVECKGRVGDSTKEQNKKKIYFKGTSTIDDASSKLYL